MFSKAVLTVKDLVMPTGLRHLSNHGRTSNDVLTILTDRALKMYREQTEVCSTYGECKFTTTT